MYISLLYIIPYTHKSHWVVFLFGVERTDGGKHTEEHWRGKPAPRKTVGLILIEHLEARSHFKTHQTRTQSPHMIYIYISLYIYMYISLSLSVYYIHRHVSFFISL